MVFNYVDTLHFYYTHLSVDPGAKVEVHNGIFIVDGGPRHRIAGMEAAPVLPDNTGTRFEFNAISIPAPLKSL